ncbi:MAG TPA: hypothetical protein VNI78_07545 [Vicinamibacterales bacterium]|nr:hypothetical protein [Vicinamibacterales bacterium]
MSLTGPRRAGKTALLRRAFPRASYHLLEDPDVVARLQADPRAFLHHLRGPAPLARASVRLPRLRRGEPTRPVEKLTHRHGLWPAGRL